MREVIAIKRNQELDKRVLEELKKGKMIKDIRALLHVGEERVNASIERLIEGGQIEKSDIKMYRRENKKRELLKYLQQGLSNQEAGREVHMDSDKTKKMIKELVDEGKIDELYLHFSRVKKEKRKEAILEKLREKKTIKESAQILGYNIDVTYRYVTELVEEGKIKREEIVKRRKSNKNKNEDNNIDGEDNIGKNATNGENKNDESNTTAIENGSSVGKTDISEEGIKEEGKKQNAKTRGSGKLTEDEKEIIVRELLQNGVSVMQIAIELDNMSYKELRSIIDRLLIEGKVKAPERSKTYGKSKEEKLKENAKRYRAAMDNIAKRINDKPISKIDQKLYFMYCRKIVESGEKLTDRELELLQKVIVYGQGNIDTEGIKFIGKQYLKRGNLKPAISLVDKCIQVRGESEEYEQIKQLLQDLQQKQEKRQEQQKDENYEMEI